MHHLTELLSLTFAFFTSIPTTKAYIPITDLELGILQEKPYCPARPASPSFQRAAFYEFISEIFFEADGFHQSFDNFISVDYIQHSPFILSGRNNTIAAIDSLGGSYDGINITIIQIMFDSPYGMVHYKFQAGNSTPEAFMDLWRFNGTCIEEHWDVIQALPANATNPLALF